jgi:hypothetical protein
MSSWITCLCVLRSLFLARESSGLIEVSWQWDTPLQWKLPRCWVWLLPAPWSSTSGGVTERGCKCASSELALRALWLSWSGNNGACMYCRGWMWASTTKINTSLWDQTTIRNRKTMVNPTSTFFYGSSTFVVDKAPGFCDHQNPTIVHDFRKYIIYWQTNGRRLFLIWYAIQPRCFRNKPHGPFASFHNDERHNCPPVFTCVYVRRLFTMSKKRTVVFLQHDVIFIKAPVVSLV